MYGDVGEADSRSEHTGQNTHVRTHRGSVLHSVTWNMFQAMKADKDGVIFRFQKNNSNLILEHE